MPDIVLRAVPDDPSEDGRELARAFVLDAEVDGVIALVNRAIGFGHEMSYVEAVGAPCGICGAYPSAANGVTYHYFHPKAT